MRRGGAVANVLAVAGAIGCLLLLAACGRSGHATGTVGVTAGGGIGPLRIDRSSRRQVISFAGRPSAETRGRYANFAPFDALGYGCAGRVATNKAGVPECKTVYYLIARTGRLALMFTRDPRYAYHGVHPGTAGSAAERDLHAQPGTGCYTGFTYGHRAPGGGTLIMELFTRSSASAGFPGGDAPRTSNALKNSYIGLLVVQSGRLGARDQNNPGVLDCIDS